MNVGALPISKCISQIVDSVATSSRIIITAPTGSGKSTQTPQILLGHCPIEGRILVLQPRRIAARMLAARVAQERNTELGGEVGFQTRFESKFSGSTKIVFITEGILPRMFLSNPELSDIGAVILDEFHERSIHSDLSLGLVKMLQEKSRPDLRLITMSATLDIERLQSFLHPCTLIQCETRQYPIDIRYAPPAPKIPVWETAARTLGKVISEGIPGDVLMFMPGSYEIRKTIDACGKLKQKEKLVVMPLFGNLPAAQQDAVMHPTDFRKIVVATNIAETSLTIPGIRIVIDSGLARINRYNPGRGFNLLDVEPISQAAAEQRAGRAGRESPGHSYRLWSAKSHTRRKQKEDPEIQRIDLSEVTLLLKDFGFREALDFPWLDPPTQKVALDALGILAMVGAIGQPNLKITKLGKKMAKLPCHPRIARMLLEANELQCLQECSMVAALLSEKPITLSDKTSQDIVHERFDNVLSAREQTTNPAVTSDMFTLIHALQFAKKHQFSINHCRDAGLHAANCRQVWRTTIYLARYFPQDGLPSALRKTSSEDILKCMIMGFPDHIVKKKSRGSRLCILQDGKLGEVDRYSGVGDSGLLLAADIREIGRHNQQSRLNLSLLSEIEVEWLIDLLPEDWTFEKRVLWNSLKKSVDHRSTDCFRGLVIHEQLSNKTDPEKGARILADAIISENLALNGWNKKVKSWIQRVRCVHDWFKDRNLVEYTDAEQKSVIERICYGETRYRDIRDKPCLQSVKDLLSWEDQQFVNSAAPEFIVLPNGRRMIIKYQRNEIPKGNAKIQDLFGLQENPHVGNGKIKVLMEILAPNMKTVQITDDLAGFWLNLYPTVKKELSRRYPKHEWQ